VHGVIVVIVLTGAWSAERNNADVWPGECHGAGLGSAPVVAAVQDTGDPPCTCGP
jgi:hypothetical protein